MHRNAKIGLGVVGVIMLISVISGFYYTEVIKRRRRSLSEEAKEALNCLREGACKDYYWDCGKDGRCIRLVRRALRESLRSRRDFPYVPSDQVNGPIEALENCYRQNCSLDRVERSCSELEFGMTRIEENHHLLNDEQIAETAMECQTRCMNHYPPDYPENCRAWTWIRRKTHQNYQMCYMFTSAMEASTWKKGVSGTCKGGADKSFESLQEERMLCERILESPEDLQVWLKVRRRLSINLAQATGLLRFMKLTNMCTSDANFIEVFNEFDEKPIEPPPSILAPMRMVYDLLHDAWDLIRDNISAIMTILSLILGPVVYMFPQLEPYVEKAFGKDFVDRWFHKQVAKKEDKHKEDEKQGPNAEPDKAMQKNSENIASFKRIPEVQRKPDEASASRQMSEPVNLRG